MGRMIARAYEPLIGRLMRGPRAAGLALCPPRAGMEVLDVGCGAGAQLGAYLAAGCGVTGLDPAPAMLGEARRRLGPAARLVQGEAAALPFPDASFDLVITATVLHQLPPETVRGALAEAARVARDRVLVLDYHPAPRSGWRPRLSAVLGTAIETLAGPRHRRRYRAFLASGGVPVQAGACGLEIERLELAASGSFGIYLLRKVGERLRPE